MPYPVRKAAGMTRYSSTDPNVFLFAGEAQTPTGRGRVKANLSLPIFAFVAFDADGFLVPWDFNGTLTQATGTVTFSGLPAANDTVTVGGTAITFVASGATGSQVNIGSTAAATAAALAAYINATVAFTVSASVAGAVVTLSAKTAGTAGNSITLAKTGTNIAVSGSTLASGTAGTTADQPNAKLVGILAEAIDTTSTGTNAATFCPYYEAGVFNHVMLPWPAGIDTLQLRKAALAGSRFSTDYLP